MRAPGAAWLLAGALLASPLAAQEEAGAPACKEVLEPAGFDGRFEVLRVLVRVAGCHLRGLVTDQTMREAVAPRVQRYARACFDPQDRRYLQEALRRGALQEAPRVDLESCTAAFEHLDALAPG